MNSTEQEGSGFELGAHAAPGFLPQSRDIHIQLDILDIFPLGLYTCGGRFPTMDRLSSVCP